MRFSVRFRIGKRLGSASKYTLGEVCVCLFNTYSLREVEIACIVQLKLGETFKNEDMEVTRMT